MDTKGRVRLLKAAVWVACLIPVARLAWRWFYGDQLGANPIEELTHWSGLSALVILLGALAVTPVRRLTGWNQVQKVRRLTGLFAFFYATLHLGVYIVLDQWFGWPYILEDVTERPYIMAGAGAFLLLLPLALTSTKGWIRRLGKNWTRLHRLVYLAAPLALLHYTWKQKSDIRDPLIVAVVLAVLLGVRLWYWGKRRRGSDPPQRKPRAREPEAAASA